MSADVQAPRMCLNSIYVYPLTVLNTFSLDRRYHTDFSRGRGGPKPSTCEISWDFDGHFGWRHRFVKVSCNHWLAAKLDRKHNQPFRQRCACWCPSTSRCWDICKQCDDQMRAPPEGFEHIRWNILKDFWVYSVEVCRAYWVYSI